MFLLKLKYIIPLALVTGLMASYGVFRYLKQQEKGNTKPVVVNIPIVVAAQDLILGTTLREEKLQVRQWPENIVPAASFQDPNVLVGRVLKTDIFAGEAVLAAKLAPEGSSGGVSSLISAGMRAMTVSVNTVSGVGGFVLPKARVDVLVTVNPSGNSGNSGKITTKIILQNVQVLAVDQTYRKNDDDPVTVQSVTLLVSPPDAEKLALAANEGELQLTLRNNSDLEISNTAGVMLSQLLGRPKVTPRRRVRTRTPPKKVEEPPRPRVVEVIRANERSEKTFEEEKGSQDKTPKP
ncbi:MAG: Flp pilus assembly protein CpaB [Desulfatiglandales bacterium]